MLYQLSYASLNHEYTVAASPGCIPPSVYGIMKYDMKWTYTIFRSDEDLDSIQRTLDSMGQDGWELVSVSHQQLVDEQDLAFDQYTFFLKQPAA